MRTISVTNRANRKPSKAENGKAMVRKVTSFAGDVIAPLMDRTEGSHHKQKMAKKW